MEEMESHERVSADDEMLKVCTPKDCNKFGGGGNNWLRLEIYGYNCQYIII